MLPDWLIHIPEPFNDEVRAYDAPASVFFYGFTDDVPFSDCWRAADWEEQHAAAVGFGHWLTGMLARLVIEPVLTPGDVNRFGPARAVLVRGVLETVGWMPRNLDLIPVDVRVATATRTAPPPVDFAALTALPGPNMKGTLQRMSTRTRTLPAVLWALPISEWMFNLRALADPQATPDDAARFMGLDV